jgi:hypothetical protein
MKSPAISSPPVRTMTACTSCGADTCHCPTPNAPVAQRQTIHTPPTSKAAAR